MDIVEVAKEIQQYCRSMLTCEHCPFAYWSYGFKCKLDKLAPYEWDLDRQDSFEGDVI